MPDLNEQRLRASFPGWPKRTPLVVLEQLRLIDRMMAPLVRGDRRWPEVPEVLLKAIDDAGSQFPEYQREFWAYALDWLAHAHEFGGDLSSAICCLEARLRMRSPRNPWRGNQYLALVKLLEAEGQTTAARAYALHGLRYSRRQHNKDVEEALARKLGELK